jgi:putative transposase
MSQSLSKLFVHIVFHISYTSVLIRKEDRKDLYTYIGAIIKDNDSIPIIINGVGNHIHILCVMSKNIALDKDAWGILQEFCLAGRICRIFSQSFYP